MQPARIVRSFGRVECHLDGYVFERGGNLGDSAAVFIVEGELGRVVLLESVSQFVNGKSDVTHEAILESEQAWTSQTSDVLIFVGFAFFLGVFD